MYGFEPNRAGFIPCPFHQEKTASLKLYPEDRGWHCFGCGEGGTTIDFVMKFLKLSFPAAMDRLNTDFHLGLGDTCPEPAELEERRREAQRRARELDTYRTEYDKRCIIHRAYWEAKKVGPASPLYAEACRELPALEYWFDTHHWR